MTIITCQEDRDLNNITEIGNIRTLANEIIGLPKFNPEVPHFSFFSYFFSSFFFPEDSCSVNDPASEYTIHLYDDIRHRRRCARR